ncbi:MAG: MOSC domain-containing protein [Acidimicrobiia bacterium]|nr:MOSC domain-containing protein [Acidimicrobiia bacterium]
MGNLNHQQLADGLDHIQDSPSNAGLIEMLVLRPGVDERTVVDRAEFAVGAGLVGDNYVARGSDRTEDGQAHHEAQVTIMNSRVLNLISEGDRDRWPLAGDQILVDMDLSRSNLPTGTRLSLGTVMLEVSAKPHTGCAKFAQRFGPDAAKWINSDAELRLRGINAMVITAGTCSVGDVITKL